MAIKFQYNKTSLNDMGKQLKVRQNALPTLKNKESALRLEVRKAKSKADALIDDPAIGVSFQKRADLVKGVHYYLNHPASQESHARRQEKLHAISAEVFAKRVVAFYNDCQEQLAAEEAVKAHYHSRRLFHRSRS